VVAGLAALGAEDVVRGLRRRVDARSLGMTGRTFARRALEHGADVAALAADVAMPAGQLEPCREVIELLAPGRLRRAHQWQQQEHQERDGKAISHGGPHWMRAPLNVIVVWQRWHWAPNCPRWMSSSRWHAAQSVGRRICPAGLRWQSLQASCAWLPVSGKSVCWLWSKSQTFQPLGE